MELKVCPAQRGEIAMVTGWRGAGKTACCVRHIARARAEGRSVGGILSVGRFENGFKMGIEVEDLNSGERRLLASRRPGELHGMQLGSWTFDVRALEWGNHVLQGSRGCCLLVVDEIGPLEFERQQGWTGAFDVIDAGCYDLALVVVRPEYEARFRLRWPAARGGWVYAEPIRGMPLMF